MQYTYKINEDDWAAYNAYHFKHSQENIKRKKSSYIAGLIIALIIILLSWFDIHTIVFALVFLGVYYWIIWWSFGKGGIEASKKFFREGKNKILFEEHQLELHDNGFKVTTDSADVYTKWQAIEKVVKTPEHIFIYIGSLQAYIVPLRFFEKETEADEFYQKLQKNTPKEINAQTNETYTPIEQQHCAQKNCKTNFLTSLGSFATLVLIAVGFYLVGVYYGTKNQYSYEHTHSKFEDSLRIDSHRANSDSKYTSILGEISNVDSHTWSSVSLEANFFDKNKQFLDQCTGYLSGKIQANSSRYFKVTCSEKFDYDTYKVKIVEAYPDYSEIYNHH